MREGLARTVTDQLKSLHLVNEGKHHFGLPRKSYGLVTNFISSPAWHMASLRVLHVCAHVHVCEHEREVQCTCILAYSLHHKKYMCSVHVHVNSCIRIGWLSSAFQCCGCSAADCGFRKLIQYITEWRRKHRCTVKFLKIIRSEVICTCRSCGLTPCNL